MTLTRRGRILAGAVVVGLASGAIFGARAIDAVIVPGVVALLAAVYLVRRADEPRMARRLPDAATVGQDVTVELDLTADRPFTASVVDEVSGSLSVAGNDLTTIIDDDTLEYAVRCTVRGEHEFGPLRVLARDVLGLAEREFVFRDRDTMLVFPRVYELTGRTRHELNLLPDPEMEKARGEFDEIREYERGDSLRDIHWKTSAKYPDELFVKEYINEEDKGGVLVAAQSAPDDAEPPNATDAMAEAAASVAEFVMEAGYEVGLVTADDRLEPAATKPHRKAILRSLALTDGGAVPARERSRADVVVTARSPTEVEVQMGEIVVDFDRLIEGQIGPEYLHPGSPKRDVGGGIEEEAIADGGLPAPAPIPTDDGGGRRE